MLCRCCLSDSSAMHRAPSSLSVRVIDVRAWNLQTFHLTIHFQRPWAGSNINSTEKDDHRKKIYARNSVNFDNTIEVFL